MSSDGQPDPAGMASRKQPARQRDLGLAVAGLLAVVVLGGFLSLLIGAGSVMSSDPCVSDSDGLICSNRGQHVAGFGPLMGWAVAVTLAAVGVVRVARRGHGARRPMAIGAAVLVTTWLVAYWISEQPVTHSADVRSGADVLDTITGALATLPGDNDESASILWGDIERAAELAGAEPPADPADREAVDDYLRRITGARPEGAAADDMAFLLLPEAARIRGGATDLPAFVEDVGWSVLQVDQFVERQAPPDTVAVLGGNFDEAAISDALGEPSDGVWVAGSGEPHDVDPGEGTPARPLGESLWLSGGDTHLAVSRDPESAEASAAALGGDSVGVLGDDPVLAALAAALDEQAAYAAQLLRPGINGLTAAVTPEVLESAGDAPERMRELCGELLPQPTLGVATGVTHDRGPVVLVALVHASADAASDNAAALEETVTNGHSLAEEQPWDELVELEGVETTGNGRVTVARLRPLDTTHALLWWEMLLERDNLVVSC